MQFERINFLAFPFWNWYGIVVFCRITLNRWWLFTSISLPFDVCHIISLWESTYSCIVGLFHHQSTDVSWIIANTELQSWFHQINRKYHIKFNNTEMGIFIFFQHSSQKAYRNLTSTCTQPWKIKHCFLTHTINNMSSYVLKGREISHWWNHHWYSIIYTYIKRTGDSDVKLLCNHLLWVFTYSTKGAQIRNYFDKQEGFTLFFTFDLIFMLAYLKHQLLDKTSFHILKKILNCSNIFTWDNDVLKKPHTTTAM